MTNNISFLNNPKDVLTAFRAFLPNGLQEEKGVFPKEAHPTSMRMFERQSYLKRLVSTANPPAVATFYKQSEPPGAWGLVVWGTEPNVKWGAVIKDTALRFEKASGIRVNFLMVERKKD